jgi:hypothetical protein
LLTVFSDRVEFTVAGAPPLIIPYGELGLRELEIVGVGSPTSSFCYQELAAT